MEVIEGISKEDAYLRLNGEQYYIKVFLYYLYVLMY